MPKTTINHDDIAEKIRELVKSHYDQSDKPFFLSALGTALLLDFPDLKTWLHDRPLSAIFTDISDMTLVRHSRTPQRIAVAFTADKDRVQEQVENFSSSRHLHPSLHPGRLQRALVFAFQQDPDDDQEVYVSLGPGIRYHLVSKDSDHSRAGWYHIRKDLLVPTNPFSDISALPAEKQNKMIGNITRWMNENDIPPRSCYYVQQSKDMGNLVLQFIDAQPREIRSRLVFPSEIILKLFS